MSDDKQLPRHARDDIERFGLRVIDGTYMIFLSLNGTLRGARYNRTTQTLGRSVALVSGIWQNVLGAGQMDLAANGLLGYVPSGPERLSAMVVRRPGADAVPLPMERGAFLRFDLSRDGRRMAAVMTTPEGDELRIYDLRRGLKQVWLRAPVIRMPLWSPRGDRIVVRLEDDAGAALVIGSPDAAGAPDTLMQRVGDRDAPDVLEFSDDSTIIARGVQTAMAFRITLSDRAIRIDTLLNDVYYMTRSPDGKRLAWHTSQSNQLFIGPYPPGTQRQQVAIGGVEPIWLSSTELLSRSSVTWYAARFDPVTGALTGAPTLWARDPRFVDTPGLVQPPLVGWRHHLPTRSSAERRMISSIHSRLRHAAQGGRRQRAQVNIARVYVPATVFRAVRSNTIGSKT